MHERLFHEATDRCGHLCPCRDMEVDHPSCLLASPVKKVRIFEHSIEVKTDQSDGEADEILLRPNVGSK
ncbi:hypothetical protein ARALYDRAFT_907024 [Arabidopsis lyrata subsp. lyrata]|uniref:Uncharacterized protein n=1 Tax=Arabidopsis lyrata subsp. lyrata TaxID=81972 RepID=D7LV99_ARALL|nr:hypothetical protein ARALYDRAFT_907024 [Arabidopsis lyrata subsp. lyrata]